MTVADPAARWRGRLPDLRRMPRTLRQRLDAWRVRRRLAGPRLVRAMRREYPRAFFVEIGAYDGELEDHLREAILAEDWRGIMVEPVPHVFERLRARYGSLGRVALENAAIADRDGELPFFHLRAASDEQRARLPDWYEATGSLSRETLLSHAAKIPDLERLLVETTVRSLTLDSLLRRHGVESVDLLLSDTEGYDREILRQVDLATLRPRLVIYEHFHLRPSDREWCREHLEGHGYEWFEEGFDTWALDTGIDDPLTRLWRRLSPGVEAVYVETEPA